VSKSVSLLDRILGKGWHAPLGEAEQPRWPKGDPRGGQWKGKGGKATTSQSDNVKMTSFANLTQIIDAAKSQPLFIRWSRGPELDAKMTGSLDQASGTRHNGLSTQAVRADNPELLARMLPEYAFLRRKDSKIYGWILSGKQNGIDSDGAPTIDPHTIKPIGRISDQLLKKCQAYSEAYQNHRAHYAYNDWKPEWRERNKQLDLELNAAWKALL
jgi:hypothetical protein